MTNRKVIDGYPFVEYQRILPSEHELISRTRDFFDLMNSRRSVRIFSTKPVPREVIENIVNTASTAPSGAHKQPWTFCIVSDPSLKSRIRLEAEKEEFENYHGRMGTEWMQDLRPFQTDWHKEFLEAAPYLIIVFRKAYDVGSDGVKRNNYYVHESVGIACGFLLAAIHYGGLVALTHTPSPMNFLARLLNRPANEKPYLLIPVGYPGSECFVPDLRRKPTNEIAAFYERS
ncbi:MAG TPA: nitroreductase family protein [Chryseosolibacter sp.]|nr:nitroreductase family protein [Chryseosolibacter sp.]